MAIDLEKYAKENGVKFFLMNFTDLFGTQRSKLVPTQAIAGMQESGAGFAGFASWLDMTPAYPDMFAIPDSDAVIQLPWKPELAWVPGDLYIDGKKVEQAPRNVLQTVIAKATEKGIRMKAGVEPEFHLINEDGTDISDDRDTQVKPCYDQSALMRRYDVISEICTHMITLGWGPYQNDHEDANGQFEINWNFYDSLKTADQMCFFRFMVKSIAEKHGMYAIFHNHGQPGDSTFNFEDFLAYSPANMLNFDVGHYFGATGKHPNALIKKLHDRIFSIHMKDKTAKDADPADTNMPWGEGDTPLEDILKLIQEKGWDIHCDIELEYQIPEGSDAVIETGICVEYCKNILL